MQKKQPGRDEGYSRAERLDRKAMVDSGIKKKKKKKSSCCPSGSGGGRTGAEAAARGPRGRRRPGSRGRPRAAQDRGPGAAKAGDGTAGGRGGLEPRGEGCRSVPGARVRGLQEAPRPPRRRRGCGCPPAARSPGRHLGSLPRLQERAAERRGSPVRPRARTHLRTGGGASGTGARRGCRGTERAEGSARSLTPLCDSGSATAPPETSRPRPISARLLTSMSLALARAVALATLKAQTPRCRLHPQPIAHHRLARTILL